MSDYAFEGPKWGSTTITWSFEQSNYGYGQPGYFSSTISAANEQAVVGQAFADWSAVTGLHFIQIADAGDPGSSADIRVGFGDYGSSRFIGYTSYYNAGANFDPGVTVTIADPASIPIIYGANNVLFYARVSATVYQVAAHEIGHALGLDHSTNRGALMFPLASTQNTRISAFDALGVQTLYQGVGASRTVDFAARGVASYTGVGGANVVYMNYGDDTYTASGQDTVVAAGARDTVNAAGGNVLAFGYVGALEFLGGSGSSTVIGGAGDVAAQGGSGSLVAWGGSGSTSVSGGSGAGNVLAGGSGPSTLQGHGATDLLLVTSGNATLQAFGANSTIFGGSAAADITLGLDYALVIDGNGGDTVTAGAHAAIFPGLNTTINVGLAASGDGTDVIIGFHPDSDHIFSLAGGGAVEITPVFEQGGFYETLSNGVLLAVFA